MKHRLFIITLGTLILTNLPPSALATTVKESQENETSAQAVKTEESQDPKQDSQTTARSRLENLNPSLLGHIGGFLSTEDGPKVAQLSQYCLKSISSQPNLELSLENKNLTEEDFQRYFGEDGIYNKVLFF